MEHQQGIVRLKGPSSDHSFPERLIGQYGGYVLDLHDEQRIEAQGCIPGVGRSAGISASRSSSVGPMSAVVRIAGLANDPADC